MTQYLTIVNYHYIRDLESTFHPRIKGVLTKNFIGQLAYFQKYYKLVSMDDCINAYLGKKKIPNNALLLTFDDGLSDHYTTVFPILKKFNIPGCFFPPVKAIEGNEVLDVHKIHFILANTTDNKELINRILELLSIYQNSFVLPDIDILYSKYSSYYRWDSGDIVFIKKLLQEELPKEIRKEICSKLFESVVSNNEKAFSRELYMTEDQLRLMIKSGMYVGGHGFEHEWLGKLSEERQRNEIQETFNFLKNLYNDNPINWALSYPKNSKNDKTVSILKEFNCALGLTDVPELSAIDQNFCYNVPRFDTNDFPISINSETNKWTKIIIESIKK